MKFKKKNPKSFCRSLLLITSVAMVSFIGVGYAIWNNSVEITTSISTARVNPIFCSNRYHLEEKKGSSNLKIDFIDDNHILQVTGDVTIQGNNGNGKNNPGYKASLHYCIKNKGTIPIKFIGDNGSIQFKVNGSNKTFPLKLKDNNEKNSLDYEIEVPSTGGKGKFKLTLNQQKGILNIDDFFYNEKGNPQLQIEATEPGNYKFEIDLPFILWNGSPNGYKSWEKVLTIKGDITVNEPIKSTSSEPNFK